MKHLGALTKATIGTLALFLSACGGNAEEDGSIGSVSLASHSWGGYHWAHTTSSFDLIAVNSLTSDWDPYLSQAAGDWSLSSVLNLNEEASDTSNRTRRRCKGPSGKVRVCNLAYGNTGWLGIAGISIDANGHITTGYTKLNDTYFADPFYDTFEWRQSVTCQEVGHTLGLDHQDEDFNNTPLFTCMDYQNPPYPYPNQHDYDELDIIYAGTDSYDSYYTGSTGGGDGGGVCNAPPGKGCNKAQGDLGESLGRHGNVERFVRPNGDGTLEITTVTWAG